MKGVKAPRAAGSQPAVQKRRRSFKDIVTGSNAQMLLMMLPGTLIFLIFNYFPIYGLVLAFKRFIPRQGIGGSPWVGLKNFEFFFTSQDAVRITRNTVLYFFDFLIVGTVCAVAVAILLYNVKSIRMTKVYNTIMILPHFLSAVIIAFIVYAVLSPRQGVLNSIIVSLGGTSRDWYANAAYWPVILTIVNVWKGVGMSSVLYFASLSGLDTQLLEAAEIDGANKWYQVIHVMIPHLVPLIIIQTILALGNMFSGDFGLFYQTPMDVGVLYPTTDIIPTYIFRGLKGGNMEISTAVGLFQNLAGFVMIMFSNAVIRRISPDNSLF